MTNSQLWALVITISFWGISLWWIVAKAADSICDELRKVCEAQGGAAAFIVERLRNG
jgi:hypothetical protein